MNISIKFIFLFFLIFGFQILILNNVNISGWINPYIYPLIIMLLPFNTPNWLLIIIAFLVGLVMDLFTGSIGMHTAAITAMAFFRPGVINLVSERTLETSDNIGVYIQGIRWFLTYSAILIFIHHLIYFFIESWNFYNPFKVIAVAFLSGIVSLLIIFFLELIFTSETKKRFR